MVVTRINLRIDTLHRPLQKNRYFSLRISLQGTPRELEIEVCVEPLGGSRCLIMPDMSGREVFDALIAMEPDVRVLVSTGYGVEGKVSDLIRGEHRSLIQKPFSIKVPANEVRRLLDER